MAGLDLKVVVNNDGSITATWPKVDGAVRYWGNVGENKHAIYDNQNLTVTTFTTKAGLEANKIYTVLAAAYDSKSMVIVSKRMNVVVPSDIYTGQPVGVPQNVKGVSDTVSVTVSFDAVPYATSYDIQFDNAVYNGTATSRKFTGLSPKTNHVFAVRAKNARYTGAYSTGQTIMTKALTPAVPSGITKTVTGTSATISWKSVANATGYDVLFNGTLYSVTGTTRTFTGLSAGSSYTYQIRAKNADAASAYTVPATVTTAPNAPATINAVSTPTSVTVSWNAVPGARNYMVKLNGSPTLCVDTTCSFTGLKPNTSYTYQVCSRSADGEGPYSAQRSIRTKAQAQGLPAPLNVTKTSSETSVTISWGAVAGATGYDLQFNNTTYSVTGTSRTFTGLTPNTFYTYRVRAKNASGAGEYGGLRSVLTAPPAPSNMNAIVDEKSVLVNWGPVRGASSYDVLFNGTVYNTPDPTRTFTGLAANMGYNYQLRSRNGDGASAYSAVRTAKTAPPAPASPSTKAEKNAVTVSWGAVTGATSYELLFDDRVYRTTGTSWTVSGLKAGTSYTYALRSVGASGSSAYGSTRTVTTIPDAPPAPTNLWATATTDTVTINWDAAPGATGYEVYFYGDIYSVTGTSKTFTGLNDGVPYGYRVRAKNEGGYSDYSATGTIKTLMKPPQVPDNIRVSPSSDSVVITWRTLSNATGYDILFDGKIRSTTSNILAITGLTPDTSYNFQLRAKNEGGEGEYSPVQTVRTLVAVPAVPTGIQAAATANRVEISWNAVADATHYEVKFAGLTVRVANPRVFFSGTEPNQDYTYQVRACNAGGASAYSAERSIRTMLETPANVRAEVTAETVTVRWDPVTGADGYDVQFQGQTYDVGDTSKTFTGLEEETDYTYRVRAKNDVVYSEYSDTETATTLCTPLAVPQQVHATATLNSVMVYWEPVEGAVSYDVEFDGRLYPVAGESATFISRAASTGANNYIFFRKLKPNTNHTYRVRANNRKVSSGFSPLQSIRTKKHKPERLLRAKPGRRYQTYPSGRVPHTGLDPVHALTGAFLWSYTCLEDYSGDDLHFTVMYDSQRDEHAETLGRKWVHSLQYLLYQDEGYFYFSTPYGEVVPFAREEDGGFSLAEDVKSSYTLEQKENGSYCVRDIDGAEYVFDSSLTLTEIREGGLAAYRFTTDSIGQITRIEGRHGSAVTLFYTGGKVIRANDAMGRMVTFTYEGEYLASIGSKEDRMGFAYDEAGCLIEVRDFSGNCYLRNVYDLHDRVIIQSIAGRGDSSVSYNEKDRVNTFTDAQGNKTRYFYDADGCITSIEQAAGSAQGGTQSGVPYSVQSKYDSDGRLTEQIDALGNSTKISYDENGRMHRVVYPDGTQEQVDYNERNLPVRMVNREGGESLYGYDGRNNLVSARDERGNQCTYSYDTADHLISYTDKNGYTWTYEYDEKGHLAQALDPEGNLYRYIHDKVGRLVSYTTPGWKTTSYEYAPNGDLLQIVDVNGTAAFTYDANGARTGMTDRMGHSQRVEYNAMGQVVLATDFMGNEYTFVYDAMGNLIRETDPLGYCREYSYDGLGNCTAWMDKNGGTTVCKFDAMNQLTEVQDAAGGVTRYTYDTMGQVKTVTDALAHRTDYSYDAMGRLSEVTDALGNQVSYTYDEAGNLLSETDADGAVTSYAYDKENQLESITNDAGTVRFTYDALGRVTAIEDADGNPETAEYDCEGNATAWTDKEGHRTTYTYDAAGRLIREDRPDGGNVSYAYDFNGNCTEVKDGKGKAHTYAYDANGRLIKDTDPLGYETVYAYDGAGNLVSVTDARGSRTDYEYDGNGNLVKRTNPAGGEAVYTYDSMNRLTEYVDENGFRSTYRYDAGGNLSEYTDANGNVWSYTYDAANRMIHMTDGGGQLTLDYTGMGKISKITDQEGAETSYRYDALGRLTEMTDGLGNRISFTYDALGRILTETDANGNTTAYEYSPSGNLLRITAPDGGTLSYTYDALGRMLTATDALGGVTSYTYDMLGRVKSMTDPLGMPTSFTYTARGEIATVTDAEGSITSYAYDGCGNLVLVTDTNGNETAFVYDAMNHQIRESWYGSGEESHITLYQYDRKGQRIREINPLLDEKVYTYDGNGNIVTVLDEDGNETTIRYDWNRRPVHMQYGDGKEARFRYNKRGELVELQDWNGITAMEYGVTGRLAKVTDPRGYVTGYGYDANGNVTSVTYPDGSMVSYAFDKRNRIASVTDAESRKAQYQYDLAGNLTAIAQPGGMASFTYNAAGRPSGADYRLEDGSMVKERYTYDRVGHIMAVERTGNVPGLAGNQGYDYDADGRLKGWQDGLRIENYRYDQLGNRTVKRVDGTDAASYIYNGMNQLVQRTENGTQYGYRYDKRGNLTEERIGDAIARRYNYNAMGYLCKGENLETGEVTEYGYNGLHMRVQRVQTVPDPAAGMPDPLEPIRRQKEYVPDFLSATCNVLAAYEGGKGMTRSVYGQGFHCLSQQAVPEPEGAGMTAGKAYFQPDIRGSELLAFDGQGTLQQYVERDVWGNRKASAQGSAVQSSAAQSSAREGGFCGTTRFAGYDYDPVIGKHFAQARFYDGGQGRMLALDPVKRGLNGYPYCNSDPVNYVDPTGEIAHVLGGAFAGAAIGGAFGFGGSVVSQLMSGERFNLRKAVGSGVNGAITGGFRGALIGSGAGAGLAFTSDFIGGAIGNAAEQWIVNGNVDPLESLGSGLVNGLSGMFYGTGEIRGLKDAVVRGARTGAGIGGLGYLLRWGNDGRKEKRSDAKNLGNPGRLIMPKVSGRDPRGGCGRKSALTNGAGRPMTHGYRSDGTLRPSGSVQRKSQFSLLGFARETVIGGLMGGLSSAAFYGAGKAVERLRGSLRGAGHKETELFLPEEYYQKMDDNISKAIAARDAEIARIQSLSKSKQKRITTVAAGVDIRTGNTYVGIKDSKIYSKNATCAEDIVYRGLGGNQNANIIITPAIRPRNNEIISVCDRCQTRYPKNQFVKGTKFR